MVCLGVQDFCFAPFFFAPLDNLVILYQLSHFVEAEMHFLPECLR